VACVLAIVASGPFLWAVFLGRPSHGAGDKTENVDRLRRLNVGISIFQFLLGSILTGFLVSQFTSVLAFSGVLLIATAGLGVFFFSRYSGPLYYAMEYRFVSNLSENEREALAMKAKVPELTPWNAILSEFILSPNSPLVAKTLLQCGLKEKFGVTVAMIERGGKRILAPVRSDLLLPFDKLFLIGTDEQLAAARDVIETKVPEQQADSGEETLGLTSLLMQPTDRFIEKAIRDSGLREAVSGLIVGVEREGSRILNPDPALVLRAGDLVWIVGDRSRIKDLRKDSAGS